MWTNFDQNYSYFELKEIDWRASYNKFHPRAAALNSYQELLDLSSEMLAPLMDVHVYFDKGDGNKIVTYTADSFINWKRETWLSTVRANNWIQMQKNWGHATMEGIPYLAFEGWNEHQINVEEFDEVMDLYRDKEALVMDVRMNGGGNDAIALLVASRFADQRRIIELVQFRNGPNHTDFTPVQSRELTPRGDWQFTKPVIVLSGRGVYSSNETFISAMKELPHVTVIGDTTGGATGNPKFFKLKNGWKYSVSNWIAYTPDMIPIEGNGIPPDILVSPAPDDFDNETDPVIKFAINYLMNNKKGVFKN